jgi:phage tail sheath protein FI
MAEYLTPGVYVEEFESGIKAMEGVGTSTAGFVGMAEKGRTQGVPVLVTSVGDFQRSFGGQLSKAEYGENRYLPYAVEAFFANGGATCYVMRTAPSDAEASKGEVLLKGGAAEYGKIIFEAASVGKWGDGVKVKIDADYVSKTVILGADGLKLTVGNTSCFCVGDLLRLTAVKVSAGADGVREAAAPEYAYLLVSEINGDVLTVAGTLPGYDVITAPGNPLPDSFLHVCVLRVTITGGSIVEVYENVSLNSMSPSYISTVLSKSSLIGASTCALPGGTPSEPFFALEAVDLAKQLSPLNIQLGGGKNGSIKAPLTADMLTGGEDIAGKRIGLNAFKELSDVFIMAVPGCYDAAVQAALIGHCEGLKSRFAVLDTSIDEVDISKLLVYKDKFDSNYAAIYHPWLQVYSGIEKANTFIPPSGAVAGVYARTDNTRGVWKAPANEVVRGVTGLSVNYNDAEQGKLNPKGINLIRALPGQGIRVWGARTLSSDGNWKYVNVRRLFIYIEESIKANTGWAVFEPNDANLWSRVQGTIRVFLTTLWRNGALVGGSAEEAFFVNVGKGSTMTEDDILNGRLICVIGVAPVRPAEFIIFRITQKMQDAE